MRNQTVKRTITFWIGLVAATGCSGDAASGPGEATSESTSGDGGSAGTAGDTTGATNPGSGSAGGSGSTGTTFFDPTGGGSIDIQCDVWLQDCPDGQKCMPWANDGGPAWNATKCVPLDPAPKQPGDTCTVQGNALSGLDDCELASMCWNVDPETGMGTCVDFCDGSPDSFSCQNPNETCFIVNDGVLILCLPVCDPLLQDCNEGELCLPNTAGDGFGCVIDASGGMGTPGAPCEFANACNPGHMCMGADLVPGCMGSAGCCAPYCDLTGPDPSTECANAYTSPGADCVPLFQEGMAPPGHEDVGLCVIPQ